MARIRNTMELMSDILQYCLAPKKKTHVAGHNNLSYIQLQKHARFMVERGWLVITENPTMFVTTERGRTFIDLMRTN